MPFALVNENGAVMYYDDSGIPESSTTYTTVILVHGLVFHGATFLPMFPYARSSNLRLIAPNLRDYPRSTPFTSSELDELCSPDYATQKTAFGNLGSEMSAFVKHIVVTEKIPPCQQKGEQRLGGLVLLSWSMGNLWSLSMLSGMSDIGDDTRGVLQSYLHTCILHDPPAFAFGVATPKELSFRPPGKSMSTEEQGDAFCDAVCTSYTPLADLTTDMSVLAARLPIDRDTQHITAFRDLSLENQRLLTDRSALTRSGCCLGTLDRQLWAEITDRALSDSNATFSNANIVVLWCDMSHSLSPYAIKCLADTVGDLTGKYSARKIAFVKVPNANHVVHIEEPKRFVSVIGEVAGCLVPTEEEKSLV